MMGRIICGVFIIGAGYGFYLWLRDIFREVWKATGGKHDGR